MIRRWHQGLAARGFSSWVVAAYGAVGALFLWTIAQFYIPGKGLSYLIAFGAKQEAARLSKIRKLDYYVSKASEGYDAQYYVQIAMDPSLQNQALKRAVDSLPYRGRRILFATTAYVFGLGQPAWILQAFAVQNVVTWFLLAVVLLHWFPPRNWDNFVRWTGVMLCTGVCLSFRNALFDGPSLLVIAFGVFLLERNRPGWATAVLALGGLGKETNLLGSAALLPSSLRAPGPEWRQAIARGLLTAMPLALWVLYIALFVGGHAGDAGARNFDLPFVAYARKWREIMDSLPEVSAANAGPFWSLLMLVALTVQFIYLVCRPQWSRAWWRIGASYALLMVFLGDAVWEGYPGAASRVLLPMQLAFNVLVPSGRGWWLVLILGNVTMFAVPGALEAPPGEGYVVRGRDDLIYGENRQMVEVEFSDAWHQAERYGSDYWRWSEDSADLLVHNPHPFPLVIRLRFALSVSSLRQVALMQGMQELWSTHLNEKSVLNVSVTDVVIPPGESELQFMTDRAGQRVGTDPRLLAMRIQNLRIDVLRAVRATP
jgi:hypothetical protein